MLVLVLVLVLVLCWCCGWVNRFRVRKSLVQRGRQSGCHEGIPAPASHMAACQLTKLLIITNKVILDINFNA